MMNSEIEQIYFQNQQQEEYYKMVMAQNMAEYQNECQQQNQHINNGYYNLPFYLNTHPSCIGIMNPHQLNNFNYPHNSITYITPSHFVNNNLTNDEHINHPIQGNQLDVNCMFNQMLNMPQSQQINNNIMNNNKLNPLQNKIQDSQQIQYKNYISHKEQIQKKYLNGRDCETKKNYDQSDFSNQLEESTTRQSQNRNSFGNQQQKQQTTQNQFQLIKQDSDYQSTQNGFIHQLQTKKNSESHDSDFTMNTIQNGNSVICKNDLFLNDKTKNKIKSENINQGISFSKRNFACGFKFISNTQNETSLISKLRKNSMISRVADFLEYSYTFEPLRLEQSQILDELFYCQQQPEDTNSLKNQKRENAEKIASLNTTIIQLNNQENSLDDPLSNLSTGTNFQQIKSFLNKKEQNIYMNSSSMVNSEQIYDSIYRKLLKKQICYLQNSINNIQFNNQNQMLKQDNIEIYEDNKNTNHNNINRSSKNLNTRITEKIEKYMKSKLSLHTKQEQNDCFMGQKLEKSGKNTKVVQEKEKCMMGLLKFEDISSIIQLETNINQEKLKKEVQQILHTFKSNHKVYFKKVRSQKEMLKDTKFHNLNKRIMKVLLSIINHPIVLSLKVPKSVFSFFNNMTKKLINSSKKLIRSTIVNDQYSHAHYNSMFLQISPENYNKLAQSQSDIDLHKSIYDIDFNIPFSVNYYKIQKANILKQYIFLVLDLTLRLNDTSKDSSVQAIRSMYIDRVIKGMEKMNEGIFVQRF